MADRVDPMRRRRRLRDPDSTKADVTFAQRYLVGCGQLPVALVRVRGTAVLYLLRRGTDANAFERFISSYTTHDPGRPSRLVVVAKGFDGIEPREIAGPGAVVDEVVHVNDTGFDLYAYRSALERVDARFVCLLNSFSRVQVDGWLDLLCRHLAETNVGIVGATGSLESMTSAIAGCIPAHSPTDAIVRTWHAAEAWRRFPRFPNPHVRTTGFVIVSELLRELDIPAPSTKGEAHALESGRHGVTRQLMRRGLEILVAGRDGRAYEWPHWFGSRTFRSGGQANLIISDNRTDDYATGTPATQAHLRRLAWGTTKDVPS